MFSLSTSGNRTHKLIRAMPIPRSRQFSGMGRCDETGVRREGHVVGFSIMQITPKSLKHIDTNTTFAGA